MRQSILKGKTVDAWLWTPIAEVESSALDQLRNVASLPWAFHHVAVMPDCHFGMGATVGSVVAMKGAVSPAAVGVDIGCFTGNTTVILADSKSHRLDDLAHDGREFVVYSSTEQGRINGAKATALMTRQNAELVEVLLDNGERIRCTPDQGFMLRDGSYVEAVNLQPETSLMPFYAALDNEGYFRVQQPNSGKFQRAHWLMARSGLLGEIPSFEGQKTIIHHKDFDKANNDPGNLQFMGNCDHAIYHRSLVEHNTHWQSEEFERARVEALRVKAATENGHAYFAARGTPNIIAYMRDRPEHFQAAVSGNGERGAPFLVAYNQSELGRAKSRELGAVFYPCPECEDKVKSHIGLFNHRRYKHGVLANHKVVSVIRLSEREDVYCLRVPRLSNFALSAGVFVHNCGMGAIKFPRLKATDLPDNLVDIRSAIESIVPVGFNKHDKPIPHSEKNTLALWQLWDEFSSLTDKVQDLRGRAASQVGTLGGGNHFIELCLDQDQTVWLVLHSGSRNIGKTLAEIHIKIARELAHNAHLPDRDLAVFLAGTPEFAMYRHDLLWAQRYAFANRQAMLDLVGWKLAEFFPPELLVHERPILCHHNYVSEETHFGEDVIVTRKGAISAKAGEMGIIPGSMGTRSYIVKGLGNPESFTSASHGAGRCMSRGAAKRHFRVEDLVEQTAGVECRKDAGVLDEIPGAYKDIDQVMEYQSDLVEIVTALKQILCVKG